MDLNTAWFILIGVLFAGYAILDGFDLGVGILSLRARSEKERDIYINAIGPVWDGNEVWLLTAGGALFAAFPKVYATVFSGFYLALILLLMALIFRATSLEFRHLVESNFWKKVWGWAFGLGSLVPALLLGVAFANILRGIQIDAKANYLGTFFSLLNPYALVVGILGVIGLTIHGAAYLATKTEGDFQKQFTALLKPGWFCFTGAIILAMLASVYQLHAHAVVALLLTGVAAAILYVGFGAVKAERWLTVFLCSAAAIALYVAESAVCLYPNLAPSWINPTFSLTIYNASSTPYTLKAMLCIALVGMPIVIAYSAYVYWVFRGKVNEETEYHG